MGLALLAWAGWWVLRAPLVDKPVASMPDVDIDLPGLRAPLGATGASPAESDNDATLAKSAAPPASGTDRCGNDQRPEYGQVRKGIFNITVVTKPAAPAYAAAQVRIDAALRASADPFDAAVADLLNVGDMRTATGALDAVVGDALASSDARIYSMAFYACIDADARAGFPIDGPPPPASCASLDAHRWARIDPGNGVPWLEIYQRARQAGDAAAQADALAHLAAATRFDGRQHAAAGAVLQRAATNPGDAAAADDLATRSIALNAAYSILRTACVRGPGIDATRLAQCQAIATTMFEHTDSQTLRGQAAMITLRATGDSTRWDVTRAERARMETREKEAAALAPCDGVRADMKAMRRIAQVGEVEAMRASAPR